jgi:DNA-binding response OmpR family regulator
MKPKILLVDNNSEFLEVQARLLVQEGYEVLTASTLSDAQAILKNDWIHLAIIDQRMEDDNSEHDISGLIMAQQEQFQHIPKVILTAFPDYESASGALRPIEGYTPAIDYVAKQKGPKVLSEAVARIFSNQIRINWELTIDWKKHNPFFLIPIVEPDVEAEAILKRAEELEDLFRRLFFDKNHIRIDRLLWQHNGRACLIVYTFKEGSKPESYIVTCGTNKILHEEAEHFNEFAPKIPNEFSTNRVAIAGTIHFAANLYTVSGGELENIHTLGELYYSTQEKVFKLALTSLFQTTLKVWHQGKPFIEKNNSSEILYRRRFNISDELISNNQFDERINIIEDQIAILGLKIECTNLGLIFHFNGQTASYPNPLQFLRGKLTRKGSVSVIHVPGILTGDNILADNYGHTWLTDFIDAGVAPLLWNFTSLESAIRYDWIETNDLIRRYEMEKCLTSSDFAKPDMRDLESLIRKPVQIIQNIRKLALPLMGRDMLSYQLGVFYQATRRLADFNPSSPLTNNELSRITHVLISMAMIAAKIEEESADPEATSTSQIREIQIIDKIARTIRKGNQEIRLAPQPFALLYHLYQNADRVCTKEELLTQVLQGKYAEDYLHTLIGRIRKAIEEEPDQPRYLITIPNAGYRLVIKPE